MPRRKTKKPSKLETVLLLIISVLTFVGYLIMYPFEQFYKSISKINFKILFKKIQGFRPIFDPKFLKNLLPSIPKIKIPALNLNFKVVLQSYLKNFSVPRIKRTSSKRRSKKTKTKKRVSKKTKRAGVKFVPNSILMFVAGISFAFTFVLVPAYAYSWYKNLPQPELLRQQANNRSTKILDREGRLLYEIYVDKKYDPVPLDRVPDHVINATLAIEDAGFYKHHGFSVLGMIRATKATVFEDDLQGASTITQQLIKNVLLTPERTLSRKVKELVLAVMVESKYSKNEILELYLNNIPYGGTAYGVQSASRKYFAKDVWDLDLAEASMLAGLPSAPSAYSPVQGNGALAKERQRQVLTRMVELGYVTKIEAEEAYAQDLVFAPQVEYIRAPHFVDYVRSQLYEKFGQRMVDFGGLTVTTTLDLDLQEKVQEIVTEEVIAEGSVLYFSNGAAVVLDSDTGEILAYVGSADYFGSDTGKYDVVTAFRQPGSSIKPVTYALAFEKGYSPATIIDDSPVTYQSYGQTYSPKNYDSKYHGKVTLRNALARSYNIPAVKLVNLVGVDNMVQLGIDLGFDYWTVGDGSYGLSVTLGGKEVQLLDLTNAYATFARLGTYRETTPFISITDNYGFEIRGFENSYDSQVLKPETAYLITDVLADNTARAAAFGYNSQLVVPGHTVAVKTGTTNDIRDNLTVGYTPTYTVGVWVGNNDNAPMNPRLASGLSGAAPIWNKIMSTLLEDTENENFEVPEGIIIRTDKACGAREVFDKHSKMPKNLCPEEKKDEKNKDKKDD